jgi:hypothetical protein
MTRSRTIAGLVGPVLVALNLSEMLNAWVWATSVAPVTYLSGWLWFMGGLAIVRFHNIWIHGWQTLLTIVGWFALLFGSLRMFAPALAERGAGDAATVLATQVGLLVVGLFLTVRAYLPDRASRGVDGPQTREVALA